MDFRFSADDEAFRTHLREFIAGEWPGTGVGDSAVDNEEEYLQERAFEKKLAQRGWLTLAWPKEYGGQGAGQVRQSIMKEECAYARAPIGGGPGGQATNLVGPAIMMHGTEEQKQRFLPPISRAEVTWCQGFSETNAGSDLANVETLATREGDYYILNGRKIWTSGAAWSDWIHVLARSDPQAPKHRGISYFLVDLKSPGINYRSIGQMTGRAGFYETTFDNTPVPLANRLGEENKGWYVATATLNFERSGVHRIGALRRHFDELVEWLRENRALLRSAERRRQIARVMAEYQIEIEIGRWLAYRISEMQQKGEPVVYEASQSKMYGTEVTQRFANAAIDILGMHGLRSLFTPGAPVLGRFAHLYLLTVHYTISAGSSEIQRNVIAERGLGLPKG